MIETWKSILGYDTKPLYQVSTFGRVKHITSTGDILMKPFQKHGYLYVGLCKNGKQKQFRLHRLVAEAFIPNPNNLPYINHKDEDKTNNRVDNLEWCTSKENANYGDRNRKVSERMKKAVVRVDPRTEKDLEVFSSIYEAAREIDGANSSHISDCCKGKRKTSGGYKWRYK